MKSDRTARTAQSSQTLSEWWIGGTLPFHCGTQCPLLQTRSTSPSLEFGFVPWEGLGSSPAQTRKNAIPKTITGPFFQGLPKPWVNGGLGGPPPLLLWSPMPFAGRRGLLLLHWSSALFPGKALAVVQPKPKRTQYQRLSLDPFFQGLPKPWVNGGLGGPPPPSAVELHYLFLAAAIAHARTPRHTMQC